MAIFVFFNPEIKLSLKGPEGKILLFPNPILPSKIQIFRS